jgi:hypothetical protein
MKFLFSLFVCFFLSLFQIEAQAQAQALQSLSPTFSGDVDANLAAINNDLFLNQNKFGISTENFSKLTKVLKNVADYAIANGTSDEGKQALQFLRVFNAMLSGGYHKDGKISVVNPDMYLDLSRNRLNVINNAINAITALGKIDNSNNSKDIATTFINEFYKDKKSSVFANELENPNNSSSEDSQINATLRPNQTEVAKPARSNTSNENNDIQNSRLPQY